MNNQQWRLFKERLGELDRLSDLVGDCILQVQTTLRDLGVEGSVAQLDMEPDDLDPSIDYWELAQSKLIEFEEMAEDVDADEEALLQLAKETVESLLAHFCMEGARICWRFKDSWVPSTRAGSDPYQWDGEDDDWEDFKAHVAAQGWRLLDIITLPLDATIWAASWPVHWMRKGMANLHPPTD